MSGPLTETAEAPSSDEAKLDDEHVGQRWSESYSLCLQLSTERGELEYMCGRLPVAERELYFALAKVSAPLDRVKLWQQLLLIYIAASKFSEAVSVSRRALAELNQHLPLRGEDMSDEQKAHAAALPVTFDNLRYLPCSPELDAVIFEELQRCIGDRSLPSLIDLAHSE